MNGYLLRLYIAGHTPGSERALRNLREICDKRLGGQYRLEVVDVLECPQLAEDQKILATPTLIRVLPPPTHRLIGDLSDAERVVMGLDLTSQQDLTQSGERGA